MRWRGMSLPIGPRLWARNRSGDSDGAELVDEINDADGVGAIKGQAISP